MSDKADFTTEEWKLLMAAPTHAATYVMTSDMSVLGVVREMKAFGKALTKPTIPPGAQDLVSSLIADMQAMTKNKEKIEVPTAESGEDPREPARIGLSHTVDLLDEKCAAEEAHGFKLWVRDIAQVVAEADKEGSHFGFGGVHISDKEEAALAEIEQILGLQ